MKKGDVNNVNTYFIKDIKSVIWLNYKLMTHNKMVMVLCGVISILFVSLIGNLTAHSEERSSLPIAIIDQDQSDLSGQLVQALKENDSIYLNITDVKTARTMLNKQMVLAYFVIKPGFQENIKLGDVEKMITVNYLSERKGVSILTDIIAGQFMYAVCYYKALAVYHTFDDYPLISDEAYLDLMNGQRQSELYNFRFDMEFVNGMDSLKQEHNPIENSLIYQQMVVGIIAFLLSFMILFLVFSITMPQFKLRQGRTKITMLNGLETMVGQLITVILFCCVLSFLFSMVLAIGLGWMGAYWFFQIWVSFMIYCSMLSIIFLVLGSLLTNEMVYQAAGTVMILCFGFLGTVGILLGGQNQDLLNISKIIPNYWFIKEFTDIIINSATLVSEHIN